MTTQKQRGGRYDLDDLLRRLPTGVAEPNEAGWSARLESTLERILPDSSALPSFDDEALNVLETPLPPEMGEPVATDPYGLSDGREANFDELHTPMQSGEQSPLGIGGYGFQPGVDPKVTSLESRRQLRWLNWTAVVAGSLAAAAALALFVQRQRSSDLEPQLAVAPGPNPSASREGSEPIRERLVANAASTDNAVAAANLPKAEGPMDDHAGTEVAVAATRTTAGAARGKSMSAAAVQPEVVAQHDAEPQLVPAAGPSTLMDHPSTGAVSAALARRLPEAQRCLTGGEAGQSVRVVFRSAGSVERVDVLNPETKPDTRNCIDRALKQLRVDPFARSLYDVTVTVSAAPAARE
ncbi:MAG TPA: hypothetical protein VIV60_31020 [Polyangiaceae bacterium]